MDREELENEVLRGEHRPDETCIYCGAIVDWDANRTAWVSLGSEDCDPSPSGYHEPN